MKNCVSFLVLCVSISSCTFLIKKYYGIKKIKNFDTDEQNKYLNSIYFDEIETYSFDSSKYNIFFSRILTLDNEKYFDSTLFILPQIRAFDHTGKQITAWQQCWGAYSLDSILVSYPPEHKQWLDYRINPNSISLNEMSKYFQEKNDFRLKNNYSILIFWSASLGRLNKKVLKKTADYKKKYPEIRMILVNMDGLVNSNDF